MTGDADILALGLLDSAQIEVAWIAPCADPSAMAKVQIATRWNEHIIEARQQQRVLFNGPIARLLGAKQPSPGGPLRLEMTDSDYRSFFVTCVCDRPWFMAHAPEAIHQALGNSMLLTQGENVVLGVRSNSVASYRGYAHVFGGVLEPPVTGTAADSSFILDHLQRELLQEIGVSLQALNHPPKLIALVLDHQLHQPELVWWGELAAGIAEHDLAFEEHDQLLTLPLQTALTNGEATIPLTPVTRSAIALLQALRQATERK
ncbi:MAG: hypothetical protein HKL96_02910 [Phycisphaerales bacterium]|nr:hypothetical protein [Phycisphaerales bacterium]